MNRKYTPTCSCTFHYALTSFYMYTYRFLMFVHRGETYSLAVFVHRRETHSLAVCVHRGGTHSLAVFVHMGGTHSLAVFLHRRETHSLAVLISCFLYHLTSPVTCLSIKVCTMYMYTYRFFKTLFKGKNFAVRRVREG